LPAPPANREASHFGWLFAFPPGSLSNDEVYALSANILSEAKIVGPNATLDNTTLAKVKIPNRDGFIPDHRP
jgi:hypothetical protein